MLRVLHMAADQVGDFYLTVANGEECEIKIKGSRFIGQALHASSVSEAQELVVQTRKRFHDARHVCSAYKVGGPLQFVEHKDDDGEPRGTGGQPLQDAISGSELHDVLVVVTRYFGGVKLGMGGLSRAYGEAGKAALEVAPRREVWLDATLSFQCPYDDVGTVEAVLAREAKSIRAVERDFLELAAFDLKVRRTRIAAFKAELHEVLRGRIHLKDEA